MTPQKAFQELLNLLEFGDESNIVSWGQVEQWPIEAFNTFIDCGLLIPFSSAESTLCPGCDQNCTMPVHRSPNIVTQAKGYIICDKKSDIGRVPVYSFLPLKTWKCSPYLLAIWLSKKLSFKKEPKKNKRTGTYELGTRIGKHGPVILELNLRSPISLSAKTHSISLAELCYFKNMALTFSDSDVSGLVNSPEPKNIKPTTNIEPTNKTLLRQQDTDKKHLAIKKAYTELKASSPRQKKGWYYSIINTMSVGKGYEVDTIRKIINS
jgi:hypothetical protein